MFYEVARNRGTVKAERPERATLTGWEKKKNAIKTPSAVFTTE